MSLSERLRRRPPGYNFTIGRILAIYAGLMVTLLLAAVLVERSRRPAPEPPGD